MTEQHKQHVIAYALLTHHWLEVGRASDRTKTDQDRANCRERAKECEQLAREAYAGLPFPMEGNLYPHDWPTIENQPKVAA